MLHFFIICSVLASLNLPAAIEDTSGTEIPQSLLEKALYVREAGGISALEASMTELPNLLQRNKELLDEVKILNIFLLSLRILCIFCIYLYSLTECCKKSVTLMTN